MDTACECQAATFSSLYPLKEKKKKSVVYVVVRNLDVVVVVVALVLLDDESVYVRQLRPHLLVASRVKEEDAPVGTRTKSYCVLVHKQKSSCCFLTLPKFR